MSLAWIGWIGSAFFFARFLVQWLVSERAKRSVTPNVFWWMSLGGSLCLGAYAFSLGEVVLLLGNAVNGAIFARNLQINRGSRLRIGKGWLAAIGAMILTIVVASGILQGRTDGSRALGWLICVTLGQALWSSRFVLQWWHAERRSRGELPHAFWWVSLAGNGLLLAYAIHIGDPVYVAGFLPGPLVQIRNLVLLRRHRTRSEPPSSVVGRTGLEGFHDGMTTSSSPVRERDSRPILDS